MRDRVYWLGFANFSGVGPGRFTKLLNHFGNAKTAWNAKENDLEQVIGPVLTSAFLTFRKEFNSFRYEEKLQQAKAAYLILNDENYPYLLKQIKNPPFVLFYKGNKDILRPFDSAQGKQIYIGVVGTRKITDYGRQVTALITRELVASGCVIVSGLALGVDAIAHKTTLEHNGRTIAVLGCGVDLPYPRENERLYNQIIENAGVIISEYGLGVKPTVGSFPSRNRIIAGLSQGIVVTEGAADSGALITAKDALANNRKVFAVPGPVTSSLSKGPYSLIKQGAVVVSGGAEILEELQLKSKRSKSATITPQKSQDKNEQQILDLLALENLHFDELVKLTKIDSRQLGTILSLMEVQGLILSLDAGFFGLA